MLGLDTMLGGGFSQSASSGVGASRLSSQSTGGNAQGSGVNVGGGVNFGTQDNPQNATAQAQDRTLLYLALGLGAFALINSMQ